MYRAVRYIVTCYDVLLTPPTCAILLVVVAKYYLTAITFSPIRHGLPFDDVNYREASEGVKSFQKPSLRPAEQSIEK